MRKIKRTESQKERDKKGKNRMEKFEEGNQIKDISIIKQDYDLEEYTVTAYQKIEPGEWEKVELTYKRKKR